jgi:hypothetical protein
VQSGDFGGLVGQDQGDHGAGRAGACGASGAVQIRLGLGRWVEVHHLVDPVHVQAAGGDVGGHQHRHLAGGKGGQGTGSGRLGQVAMQGAGPDAGMCQLAGKAGGAVLGPHEHQGPAGAGCELGRDRDLVAGPDAADLVVHPGGRGRGGGDRVLYRVGEVAADDGVDLGVEGG